MYGLKGHIRLFLFLYLKTHVFSFKILSLSKLYYQDTKFFSMKHDLKGHGRSHKAFLAKFFLSHSFIKSKFFKTNTIKTQIFHKMKLSLKVTVFFYQC